MKLEKLIESPQDYQRRLVDALENNRIVVGKKFAKSDITRTVLAYLLEQFTTKPDVKIGVFCINHPTMMLTVEAFDQLEHRYRVINKSEDYKIFRQQNNKFELKGRPSSISFHTYRSEQPLNGKKFDIVFLDDAAFNFYMKEDEAKISATFGDNTQLIVFSNPNGKNNIKVNPICDWGIYRRSKELHEQERETRSNWFFDLYTNFEMESKVVFECSYDECKFWTDKNKDYYKRLLPPENYMQDVEGVFMECTKTLLHDTSILENNPVKDGFFQPMTFETPFHSKLSAFSDASVERPDFPEGPNLCGNFAPDKTLREVPLSVPNGNKCLDSFDASSLDSQIDEAVKNRKAKLEQYVEKTKNDAPTEKLTLDYIWSDYARTKISVIEAERLSLTGIVLGEEERKSCHSRILNYLGYVGDLQLEFGTEFVTVKGIRTKISARFLEYTYIGLSEVVNEDFAAKKVAEILRKKLKKLF